MSAARTDGLIKNFAAGAAIAPRLFVKFGTSDDIVNPGAAATDAIIGVSVDLSAAIGDRVDVALSGLAEITYGGVVNRGDLLVSDALGRAVSAGPAAGANVRTGGTAMASGVLGDTGVVLVNPQSLQG